MIFIVIIIIFFVSKIKTYVYGGGFPYRGANAAATAAVVPRGRDIHFKRNPVAGGTARRERDRFRCVDY